MNRILNNYGENGIQIPILYSSKPLAVYTHFTILHLSMTNNYDAEVLPLLSKHPNIVTCWLAVAVFVISSVLSTSTGGSRVMITAVTTTTTTMTMVTIRMVAKAGYWWRSYDSVVIISDRTVTNRVITNSKTKKKKWHCFKFSASSMVFARTDTKLV